MSEKNYNILLKPRITEKATFLASDNKSKVVTFEIDPRTTKSEVIKAVKDIYNIQPLKVNVVSIPAKKVVRRGKKGVKSGIKKALIYLKPGDNIDIV